MNLSTTRSMWAYWSPTPSTPLPCVPKLTIVSSSTRIPVAANKFQRRTPPLNDLHHIAIGGLGRTALAAAPKSNSQSSKPSNSKQEERQLRGSDVLLALQRAAAQKIKKKKPRRDFHSSSSSTSKNRGRQEKEEDSWDFSSARPICVKSEWNSRLDELENRLQELIIDPTNT